MSSTAKTPSEALSSKAIEDMIAERVAFYLGIPPEQVDRRMPLVDYMLDSTAVVGISGELEIKLGRRLSPTLLWEYPTIEQLAQHLAGAKP